MEGGNIIVTRFYTNPPKKSCRKIDVSRSKNIALNKRKQSVHTATGDYVLDYFTLQERRKKVSKRITKQAF